MRKLLWLPLAAALGVVVGGSQAFGQAAEEFGVLKTTPAAAPVNPPPRAVPAGVEPVRPATPAAARPANPYPVSAEAGAWMICAASYIGPDGPELSRQVAQHLRERHKLAAFIYNRGDEERRRQEEEYQALQKQYPGVKVPKKVYRVQDQYAVLVGGFKDFDHASAYLPKLKQLPAPELRLDGGKSPYELMTYHETDPETKKPVARAARLHPFANAMVVHNPAVPNEKANKPKWDPFWKKLNENEEYSLLKNPKPYTLVVKEYLGARVIQGQQKDSGGGFLAALGLGGGKEGEALDAGAQQAHELAKFLRQPSLGFTAWVLHTRYSSVVCVGGFDGPGDGECQRLQRQIANLRFNAKNGVDPIGLMPTPMPVEVPKP
ncbi:MAG: hypothetical protein U0797_29310 [Gemmataceae bacterium]